MREQLIEAVAERLARVQATGDPATLLVPEAIDEVKELSTLVGDSVVDLEALHVLGWFHWYGFLALGDADGEGALELAVIDLTPCFVQGVTELPDPLLPLLAENAVSVGAVLLKEAAAALEPEVVDATVEVWRRIVDTLPEGHPVRATSLARLGESALLAFSVSRRLEDIDSAVDLGRESARIAGDEGELSMCRQLLGRSLLRRYETTARPDDLDEAIAVQREAARGISMNDIDGLSCLVNLCHALCERYDLNNDPGDLDEAVIVGRAALASFPVSHPDHALCALSLGNALHLRYERSGRQQDIDDAVSVCRTGVESAPSSHPERAACLQGLSNVLRVRAERTWDRSELDESIALARDSLAHSSPDHPDYGVFLNTLGTALHLRFERTGNSADLDEAVTTIRTAAQAAPECTGARNMCLTNLCMVLGRQFERTRSPADLDEAIDAARTALGTELPYDPYRLLCLVNLCVVLGARFQQTGAAEDLDEAISLGRNAIRSLPEDHPDRVNALVNLAAALAHRFEYGAERADVEEAITLGRDALRRLPSDSPKQGLCLSNLSTALDTRFQLTGADTDLNESITIGRGAIRATPEGHPDHAWRLSSLSASLLNRSERTGALADLDEAVATGRAAVGAALADDPQRAVWWANLGSALVTRSQRTGSAADLEDAVAAHQTAVEVTPASHPNLGPYLSTLSITLRLRFIETGDPSLADDAVEAARGALRLPLVDRRRHPIHLGNLGMALFDRYRHLEPGRLEDLNEAIAVLRQAADATPGDQPRRAVHLKNLAVALANRAYTTRAFAELGEAVAVMRTAAGIESAAPSVRVESARWAALLADDAEAADLLESAVRLLPTTVPRLLDRSDQQHTLGRFSGLASEAAAAALRARGDAATALQLLELGRGVLFSQALDTRSDLTELKERHPAFADRFVRLRDALERPDRLAGQWMDERIHLATEFQAVAAEIRSLDGFADFLLPPDIDRLLQQAGQGDVVVVNIGLERADALLLRPDGVRSVPLPGLTHDDLLRRVEQFHEAVDLALGGYGGPVAESAERALAEILEWLWDVLAEPVLDELGHRAAVPDPPRVWWSPTGPLGHLPLHAAGYHRESPTGRTVLDRVTSSYTPTVRALEHARTRQAMSTDEDRALIVAMPSTPGHSALHHVADEALRVAQRISNPTVLITDPTRDAVLTLLPDSTIAHFACHGSSTPADPSQSRLLLSDHETKPLTVASLAPIRLEHARLAYLSACRSAFNGAIDLIDEAIHLTAAFQLTGYPHVIGTLWEIDDSLAAQVAGNFYTQLDTGQGLDTTRAAHALHHTTRALRDQHPRRPSQWAAYLHAGA